MRKTDIFSKSEKIPKRKTNEIFASEKFLQNEKKMKLKPAETSEKLFFCNLNKQVGKHTTDLKRLDGSVKIVFPL